MTIATGQTLSHYEIIAPIGAGGMGEVYKARDTRLDRTVAIKVLPEHLSSNGELKKRFEQEARAVSSLNHPNICTLHDVGHHNGVDFLVMELIEGETLADRLSHKGALGLDEALQHGFEIADALDKAHRQGVVHRDLKPGNIILSKTGAKLLDFGLATRPSEASDESSLTEARPLTQAGSVMGTPAYMAPEQLEGRDTDVRTDVFAFGAVLHEMLSGKKASTSDELPAGVPKLLARLAERCLAKDPDRRWQSMGDVAYELQWIRDQPEELAAPAPSRLAERLAWATGLALAVAIGGLVVSSMTRQAPSRVVRFTTEEDAVLSALAPGQYVKITPDGSTLLFVGTDEKLYRRVLDSAQALPVGSDSERALSIFASPDSQWVGYSTQSHLKKVPVAGGPAVTICACPQPRGASWGSDGFIVFGSGFGGLSQVPAAGGEPQPITTPPEGVEHNRPVHLPEGKGLLLTVWSHGVGEVAVLPAGETEPRVLLSGTAPVYVSTGHLVFQREGALFGVPFDVDALRVEGEASPVVEDVQVTGNGAAQFAFSTDGTLVFVSEAQRGARRMTWIDRNGNASPALDDLDITREPVLSPDGTRVAVATTPGLSVFDLETQSRTALLDVFVQDGVAWSADGRFIAHKPVVGGGYLIQSIAVDGAAETETLFTWDQGYGAEGAGTVRSWSPDGRHLALAGRDLWLLEIGGEATPLSETRGIQIAEARFSPDGRFLAYLSNESGAYQVRVLQVANPGTGWAVSSDRALAPAWSRDGNHLLYFSEPERTVIEVDIETEPTFAMGARRALPMGDLSSFRPVGNGLASPDGERFLFVDESSTYGTRGIEVVLNWHDELWERVPVP